MIFLSKIYWLPHEIITKYLKKISSLATCYQTSRYDHYKPPWPGLHLYCWSKCQYENKMKQPKEGKYHLFNDLNRKKKKEQDVNFKIPPLIITPSWKRWHHQCFDSVSSCERPEQEIPESSRLFPASIASGPSEVYLCSLHQIFFNCKWTPTEASLRKNKSKHDIYWLLH